MKKICLALLLLPCILMAEVDERKSDVFFANGIDTTQDDADKSAYALRDDTELDYPKSFNSIANWKVSYNKTKGFQQDIYESSVQKIFSKLDESHSLSQYSGALVWIVDTVFELPGVKSLVKGAIYYAGKKIVKEELKDLLLDEAKRTFAKKGLKLTKEEIAFLSDVLFDELLDNLLSGTLDETRDDINTDVETQALAYAESIKQGHGVIIVAHSQGNFFTNFVVEEKMVDWTKQYFNVIGVATPTSSIANGGPHLTFNNDVIQVVPEHLASNVPNPKHYYIENAIGEKVETFVSIEAHSFLSSYMATDITRDAILGFIDGSVTVHKTALSQWQKSAATNCGCKQRIQVEHKFDASLSALMEGLDVIAFDEADKLYPTGFDYVKASAEGDGLVKYDKGDICIDLLDANATKIDDFKGRTPVVTSAQGDIEVTLSWNSRKSAWKTAI